MVKTEKTFAVESEFTTCKLVNISASTESRGSLKRKPDLTYDLETILEKLSTK